MNGCGDLGVPFDTSGRTALVTSGKTAKHPQRRSTALVACISEIVHAIEWRQGQTYRAAILSENDGAESECRLDRILNFMHHELGQLAPLALHSQDIRDPAKAAVDCADASDTQPSGEAD